MTAPNDPQPFLDSPARDARFTVVDTWRECANFPMGIRARSWSSCIGR